MKGDFVLIRGFEDVPYLCRVWEVIEDTILVVSKEEFINKINGKEHLNPIGFPFRCVYRYTPDAHARLQRGEIEWSNLEAYGREKT